MPMNDPRQRTPPPPQPPVPEEPTLDDAPKGNLDLDDTPQINNQHLEVR